MMRSKRTELENAGKMVARQSQSREPITLHGLVVPSEWDEEGRPTTLSIATFNEEEYVIGGEAGHRLLESLGQEVVISGVPQEIGKKKFLRHCSILKIKATPLQPLGEGGLVVEEAVIVVAVISLIIWIACFI